MFGVLCLWPGPGALYDLLAAPLVANLPPGATLIATNVISPFLVPLKITLMAAFLVALPVVLYQVWAFVAPGLTRTRRSWCCRWWSPARCCSSLGVAFCYFFVFGQVVHRSSRASRRRASPPRRTSRPTSSFVLTMFLAFGAAFEVPIVGGRAGAHGHGHDREAEGVPRLLHRRWRSSSPRCITPPDVVSQLALAIPMCLLYEVGIWAAQMFIKHTKAPEREAAG